MRKLFLILVLLFLALQFVRPAPNSGTPDGPDDLIVRLKPPEAVSTLLRESCYDCHSDSTRYPWYSRVQPLGWWLANHIDEGKSELNFSHFGRLTEARAIRKLEHCIEALEDGEMPLQSYKWIHPKARLTPAQVTAFNAWAQSVIDPLKKATPPAPKPSP